MNIGRLTELRVHVCFYRGLVVHRDCIHVLVVNCIYYFTTQVHAPRIP